MSLNPTNLAAVTPKVAQTGVVSSVSSGSFTGDLVPINSQAAFVSIPAAITGGESPTEAEHNALRTSLVDIRQALIDVGIMLPS